MSALAVLAYGAYLWYASYQPARIAGYNVPVTTTPDFMIPRAAPRLTPFPTAIQSRPMRPEEYERYGYPTPTARATAPNDPAATVGDGARPAEFGVSDTDRLQQRIDSFRSRYRPVKTRIDELEREVADLRARASRFIGGGNSGPRTEGDMVRGRLSMAENELDRARIRLNAIVEEARLNGVSYGQLY